MVYSAFSKGVVVLPSGMWPVVEGPGRDPIHLQASGRKPAVDGTWRWSWRAGEVEIG